MFLKPKDLLIRLGLPGAFKTLDMTENEVLPALIAGEDVYASYWLNWNKPNFHYFDNFEQIKDVRNALIAFDEVTDIFDPREWEKEGKDMKKWFRCHRKRHNSITVNTQDVSFVTKYIGVLCTQWMLMSADDDDFFTKLMKGFGSKGRLFYSCEYSDFREVKRRAMYFEDPRIVYDEEGEEVPADIDGFSMSIPQLLHRELDDYKIELVHKYCPKCESRQGSQILKEDTDKVCYFDRDFVGLLKEEYCPKHKDQLLEVRYSGMFDTDFETTS